MPVTVNNDKVVIDNKDHTAFGCKNFHSVYHFVVIRVKLKAPVFRLDRDNDGEVLQAKGLGMTDSSGLKKTSLELGKGHNYLQ
jgi:hypothetical protein